MALGKVLSHELEKELSKKKKKILLKMEKTQNQTQTKEECDILNKKSQLICF